MASREASVCDGAALDMLGFFVMLSNYPDISVIGGTS